MNFCDSQSLELTAKIHYAWPLILNHMQHSDTSIFCILSLFLTQMSQSMKIMFPPIIINLKN